MHILLVANANSVWIQKYIEKILLPLGADVSILSQTNTDFFEFYQENGINVITMHPRVSLQPSAASSTASTSLRQRAIALVKSLVPGKIKKIVRRVRIGRTVSHVLHMISTPDIIHMHYISPDMEYTYAPLLRAFKSKLLVTYWGSDLLRITQERVNECLLQRATGITFMTVGLYNRFHEIYGTSFDDKLHIIDFGVSVYDALDQLKQTPSARRDDRMLFGIPEGKVCIMAGYNANPGQQHYEIIDSINRLPKEMKDKCHVLLQYSYNYTDKKSYYESILDKLHDVSFSWGIIDNFLNDEQSARLRNSVDIFIHAQITDALSASMLEYLYVGSIVLNGSWLKYYELQSRKIAYLQFDTFHQLSDLLKTVLENLDYYKESVQPNQASLYALNSWAAVKDHWFGLYNQCLEELSHAKA